jgi:hypothetical protein
MRLRIDPYFIATSYAWCNSSKWMFLDRRHSGVMWRLIDWYGELLQWLKNNVFQFMNRKDKLTNPELLYSFIWGQSRWSFIKNTPNQNAKLCCRFPRERCFLFSLSIIENYAAHQMFHDPNNLLSFEATNSEWDFCYSSSQFAIFVSRWKYH